MGVHHLHSSSPQQVWVPQPYGVDLRPADLGLAGFPVDSTGNGIADATGYDTNADGIIDALDTTGDGLIDRVLMVVEQPPRMGAASVPVPGPQIKAAPSTYLMKTPSSCCAAPTSTGPPRTHLRSSASTSTDPSPKHVRTDGSVTPRASRSTSPDRRVRLDTTPTRVEYPANVDEDQARNLYERIDRDKSGSICMMEFMNSIESNAELAQILAPGVEASKVMSDESAFQAATSQFQTIARGKKRISYASFHAHLMGAAALEADAAEELAEMFHRLDPDKAGNVSMLQLLQVVQRDPKVASFMLPGIDCSKIKTDKHAFDTAGAVFDAIAGGKKRFTFQDFQTHFRKTVSDTLSGDHSLNIDRSQHRVLILGQGFGRTLNPQQAALVENSGFHVQWVLNLPNPEHPGFPAMQYMPQILSAIEQFKPDLVAAASKGGAYISVLWKIGAWKGPTLLLNAHPTVTSLPDTTRVVLAHGSRDEVYPRRRRELEKLISTATVNTSFLYWTGDSGALPSGQLSRVGDQHNMQSILMYDCLPRLMEAAIQLQDDPETFMIRSWRQRLSDARLKSEGWLGHTPDQLRRLWTSSHRRGDDPSKLFQVHRTSEEFACVEAIFRSAPREAPAYCGGNYEAWARRPILSIQRVENGKQLEGSAKPWFEAIRRDIADQGVRFEPGVHTRWAFHGTDAIDSIVNSTVSGFQPLASGTKGAALWGSGTYFARDSKYVAEGGFCSPGPDGNLRMLLCLLVIGIPCLGEPFHRGVLPMRQKAHRYNSTVDSLSTPEIFVVQHPGAAYPAYQITFG